MDLRGRLGLREWFRDAVGPVVGSPELLYAGYHPKQGAGSTTPQPTTPKPLPASVPTAAISEKTAPCTDADLDALLDLANAAQDILDRATENAQETKSTFDTVVNNKNTALSTLKKAVQTLEANKQRFGAVLDPLIKRSQDKGEANALLAAKFVKAAAGNLNVAKQAMDDLSPTDPNSDFTKAKVAIRTSKDRIERQRKNESECNLPSIKQDVDKARAFALKAQENADVAKENVTKATDNLKTMQNYLDAISEITSKPIDPPIASMGESVQFILVYGGNVTPTWTFVRFKGPNSPLFSTSGTRTHTLNITLGPVNPETNAPSQDVKQNQFYLQLNSIWAPLVP